MEELTIKVKVIKAILTHNTQIGSEMDPFVVLKMGTNQQRGKTFDEAGDMPVFNQQFKFPYQGHLTMFHLIVYDEDVTIDDLVGQVQIDLKPIVSQQFTKRKWYSLKYDGKKPAGKIMLEFQCNRDKLTVSQNLQLTKQLIKPNIHRIGMVTQAQRRKEIHNLRPRQFIRNHKQYHKPSDKVPQPHLVFSFRDNTWHNKQQTNIQSHQLHPICIQPSFSTLHTQGSSIYDSQSIKSYNERQNNKKFMTSSHILSNNQLYNSQMFKSQTYYSANQNIPLIIYQTIPSNPSIHNNFVANHQQRLISFS